MLITAAASGIGLQTALDFLQEGARVFICDADAQALQRTLQQHAGLYGFPRRAPYASAKSAIRGLSKTLAQELGPKGVRVNCVCPGSVEGERMDRVIAAEAHKTGSTPEAVRALFTQTASLRSFVSAQDVSNAIRFLASARGARVSGQELVVDGNTETLCHHGAVCSPPANLACILLSVLTTTHWGNT